MSNMNLQLLLQNKSLPDWGVIMKKLIFAFIVAMVSLCITIFFAQNSQADLAAKDQVVAKDYKHLLGTLDGISDKMLKQHFQLYYAYVKSLNDLNTKLKQSSSCPGNSTYSSCREIIISKPFAQNGIVLHELYFSNLSGKETSLSPILNTYLCRDFGSYDKFITELREVAKSARSGWVMTGYNSLDGKIYNYIIDLHDEHVPLSVTPILVIDVWEHAYTTDYEINKAAYIEAVIKNIDWNIVSRRLEAVETIASKTLAPTKCCQ